MEFKGIVREIIDEKYAMVDVIDKPEDCGGCKNCTRGCSSGSISKMKSVNSLNAKLDDDVLVLIEDKNGVLSTFMIFALPLILGIIASGVMEKVSKSINSPLVFMIVWGVSIVCVLLLLRKLDKKKDSAKIIKILKDEAKETE